MIKIHPDANSIQKIFGHCSRQMDMYLAKYTGEKIFPQPKKSIEELIKGGYTLVQFIEAYLLISEAFFSNIKKTPEADYTKPIDKGEKLVNILQRISLHFAGHMGQICYIRKILANEVEGSYTFIKAMSMPTRKKLRKEWFEWWEHNQKNLF